MKNSIKEEIGKTIKKIRLDHSDKIEELALKSGVATSTLSRYENGKNMKIETLEKILKPYNVELDIFFEEIVAKMQQN